MERCGDPSRPHGWITPQFVDAYDELHRLGWAHSVETYLDGRLVGGLYGVRIGGLFAGESMFSACHRRIQGGARQPGRLAAWRPGATLLDVQWTTPHLASIGAVDVPRADYLELLADAIAVRS